MKDILTSIANTRRLAGERFMANKPIIFKVMQEHGIPKILVTYCGGGDSGCVESVDVQRDDGGSTPDLNAIRVTIISSSSKFVDGKWVGIDEEAPMALNDALEQFAYDWLENNHPGWENNDGGDGELLFDLAKEKVFITHNSRYTEIDTSEVVL